MWRTVRFCAFILWCVASAAPQARAQGTIALVPDPITGTQLEQYASRLNLSAQQRVAVADMHQDYAREFQTLREKEIPDLQAAALHGATRAIMRRRDDLLGRIAAIDGRFFDHMQEILTPDQVAALQRVRLLRERDRLMQDRLLLDNQKALDLGVLLGDLKLDATEVAAIQPLVDGYEDRFTASLCEIAKANHQLFDDLFKALDAAGLDEAAMKDPAKAQAAYAIGMEFGTRNQQRVRDALADLRTLNRQTYVQIRAALPAAAGRSLRSAFFAQAYRFANLIPDDDHASMITAMAGGRTLTDEQRAAIDAALTQYDSELDAALAKYADAYEQLRRQYTPQQLSDPREAFAKHGEQEREANLGLDKVRSKAYAAIEQIVGPQKMVAAPRVARPSSDPIDLMDPRSMWRAMGTSHAANDWWFPAPPSAQDWKEIVEALHTDDAALDAVKAHYQSRLDAWEAAEHAASKRAFDTIYHPGAAVLGDMTPANVNGFVAARRTAVTALDTIERSLFSDLAVAVNRKEEDADIARLRDRLLRQWHNRGMYGGRWGAGGPGGRYDMTIDLYFFMRHRQPDVMTEPAIAAILGDYEAALSPLLARKFPAMVECDAIDMQLRASDDPKILARGDLPPDYVKRRDELEGKYQKVIDECSDAIVALNGQTLQRLEAALPTEAALRIRRDFERLCYPNIFRDLTWAGATLDRALHLEGLPQQQRAQVEQLAAEYNPAYDEMCRKMIAAIEWRGSAMFGGTTNGDSMEAAQKRRTLRMQMAFDRNELNVKTLNRLKALLSEEQVAQIGGLPSSPEFRAEDFGV